MKKILISWIATTNDFFETNRKGEKIRAKEKLNYNGPHFNLYEDSTNFDAHYLLSQHENESAQWEFLASELRKQFKKEVFLKYMNISDITSVGEIKGKVSDFLKTNTYLKGNNLEVFISPGTPAMQTAWYLIGTEFSENLNIKFFKRRERNTSKEKIPLREYLDFDTSEYARITNIREQQIEKPKWPQKAPFITDSLKGVYRKAYQVAGNNKTTVLIQGDTGTGKEYLARYIHDNSHRKNRNYVAINCGAFRGDLLESRLFGYEEGAFTGANKTTKGAFEDAQGGTLFLDEIGDITIRMQITLLRVLETKKVAKIGSTREVDIDVRIIAASNKNLWELCTNGKFRFDLYYRLAIAELQLPSFFSLSKKERKVLIQYFMEKMYTPLEKRFLKLSDDVWDFLLQYQFPGNIREIRNTVETFYTFCENEVELNDIPERLFYKNEENSLLLDDVIKKHVEKVHELCNGNISETARVLKRNKNTVRNWLK